MVYVQGTLQTGALLLLLWLLFPELITHELPLKEPRLKEGDLIPLFANNVIQCVGCKNFYYRLPFCPPGGQIPERKRSLEEIISSDCFTKTKYELKFKVGTVGNILCEKTLTKNEVNLLKQAVNDGSQYQMCFNNIFFPTDVGFVKLMGSFGYYLVKHIDFYPQYYEDQVVGIKSIGDVYSAVDITEDAGIRVNFTYSVFWRESKTEPTKSISQNSAATKIQWWNSEEKDGNILFKPLIFWVLNLFVVLMVIYLTRRIRSPSVPEPREEGLCVPAYRSLLSAILGIGTQNLIMISVLFTFGFPDMFYELDLGPRTSLLLAYILLFSYYGYDVSSCQGEQIIRREHGWGDFIQPVGIPQFFVLMFLSVLVVEQMVKFAFGPANMFSAATIIVLTGVATLFSWFKGGRIAYSRQYRPPRPRRNRRQLVPLIPPRQSRLMSAPAEMFLGGLLPFLAIFLKMDEIYASLLSLKVCGAVSTLILSFFLVILITILVGVVYTSFHLRRRYFTWWWRSVFRGGSTAIFMFAYGIYFHCRINQDIFANLYMFLVYNICLCSVFFVTLGATGFHASSLVADGYRYGAEES